MNPHQDTDLFLVPHGWLYFGLTVIVCAALFIHLCYKSW